MLKDKGLQILQLYRQFCRASTHAVVIPSHIIRAVGAGVFSGASHGLVSRNPGGFALAYKPALLKLVFPHP